MDILDRVDSPSDLKALPDEKLPELCAELREFLIQNVSKTGGHLASNLGVVELSVAIHRVFDTSTDRLIFDVGHQCYVHKILTGRKNRFHTLRQFGGLSGFPRPEESAHDAFIAGHASNSISVGLGMARARTITGAEFSVIALMGDGALTGGLAYEALSDAGESGEPMIIILNDNGMSITNNVGGVSRYLSRQRMKPSYAAFKRRYRKLLEKLPCGKAIYKFTHNIKSAIKETILHCSMFEEMGLQYIGPVDGHNVSRLTSALEWAKGLKGPVVVHVITQKGRGYAPAESSPEDYHGVAPFDINTGIADNNGNTFSSAFGQTLTEIAECDHRICAITASMASGTGLTGFAEQFPERFFDVGIAEGHAVTMAAGLAAQGAVPVFAAYSTFLQRSYDMLIHDVAISGLHVIFAVDRAGLVPGDGETHQGMFDVAYLRSIPGMTILCPASFAELSDMLRYAIADVEGPVAIRYPRGGEGEYKFGGIDSAKCVREGRDYTIVTYGISINTAINVAEILSRDGISVEIIKLGIISPVDIDAIADSVRKTGRLLVLEESMGSGGLGESIAAKLAANKTNSQSIILMHAEDMFYPGGDVENLRVLAGIDKESVCDAIRRDLRNGQNPA
ncbi:MAG: 1-deoxy-D-xylulose-5-phosphate synthase [Oscillospiraceae bacterium]|nr:1-deoxy-D-xylulose-5-phosphate synthase [Oscillospiraceae bacterium]